MHNLTRNGLVFLCLPLMMLNACAHQGPAEPAAETRARPADLRACAETAYREDDLPGSERCYQELLDTEAATAEDWYRLGNVYARSGRSAHAINAYNEALRRDPGLSDAWYNLGIVHMRRAVNSFAALQGRTRPGEPLHEESATLIKGILKLIDGAPER